jgi:N-formylmaleamate deformylase
VNANVVFDHLEVNGLDVNLHLLTTGDQTGVPVIFLPGIVTYSRSLAPLVELMPKNWYSLILDLRGRGKSSWPERGYLLNDYVDDLLNVINALIDNPVAPILVGQSMGARIAAAFAARWPALISGMVLIDPPINGPGQRSVYAHSLAEFLEQKAAVDEGRMDAFRRYLPTFSDAKLEERADEYRNVSKDALIESYGSMVREPFQAYVKAATCPTLLLAAENADTIRTDELATLRMINPRLRGEVVKGVTHMIAKDAPQKTADLIIDFVHSVHPGAIVD